MSSVPGEILLDILQPLGRWTLDDVQFTDRRFLQLIMKHMSDVCLRQVNSAHFDAPNANTGWSYVIRVNSHPERQNSFNDAARLFAEFVRALRSSRVACFVLNGLVFTPERVALVLQTPIATGALTLGDSCAQLTPTQFHNVLVHFSPTSLNLGPCRLRASQITDGLLRAMTKKGMRNMVFPVPAPVDGGSFYVTEDAIVDFFLQEEGQLGQEGGAAPKPLLYGQLVVYNGTPTKDLFKRLVEANSVCTRTQPLQIVVSPARVDEEDLRAFAQHISYRQRGTSRQVRIYDFPGEQHGADAAMHLQIKLSQDNRLELIRARPPHIFFNKSD